MLLKKFILSFLKLVSENWKQFLFSLKSFGIFSDKAKIRNSGLMLFRDFWFIAIPLIFFLLNPVAFCDFANKYFFNYFSDYILIGSFWTRVLMTILIVWISTLISAKWKIKLIYFLLFIGGVLLYGNLGSKVNIHESVVWFFYFIIAVFMFESFNAQFWSRDEILEKILKSDVFPDSVLKYDSPEQSNDSLNRKPQAKKLIELVRNTSSRNSSFSIAIEGEWGSGKTTFMNFMKEELEYADDFHVFEFNPWTENVSEKIAEEFLLELNESLGDENQILKRAIERLRKSLRNESSNIFVRTFTEFFLGESKVSISGSKEEVVKTLIKNNVKLIVFFDDLDRMQQHELEIFFRLLRGVFDWGNTFFVVGIDSGQLLRILGQDVTSNYLDKFFQLKFPFPQTTKDIYKRLLVEEVQKRFNKDIKDIFNKINAHPIPSVYDLVKSKRDVTLILNTLRMTSHLIESNVDFETLLKLEILKHYKSGIFEILANETSYNIRTVFLPSTGGDLVSDILSDSASKTRFKEKLKQLLPNEEDSYGYIADIIVTNRNLNSSLTILNSKAFDLYFSYYMPDNLVKFEDYEDFKKSEDLGIVKEYLESWKARSLRDLFENKLGSNFEEFIIDDGKLDIIFQYFSYEYKNTFASNVIRPLIDYALESEIKVSQIEKSILKHFRPFPLQRAYLLGNYCASSTSISKNLIDCLKQYSSQDDKEFSYRNLQQIMRLVYASQKSEPLSESNKSYLKKIYLKMMKDRSDDAFKAMLIVYGSRSYYDKGILELVYSSQEEFEKMISSTDFGKKVKEFNVLYFKLKDAWKAGDRHQIDFDWGDHFDPPRIDN